ncbi:TetR family transcriptional regulator [Embleya sp. NPDC005971]|uniref:TetR/AcrR family transcriptional regulator n=1 Tax=Embleya sp. NPDC005971 TaxID=3156724 RepID=UPI0033D621FD
MAPDPEPTRRKLIDAATLLFAERGVGAVSRAEIGRAAGQRNTAALVYHFGNLDGILRVILDDHVERIRERRLALLSAAMTESPTAVRPVIEALVRPIADLLIGNWRDRAHLRIHAEVTNQVWSTAEVRELSRRGGADEAHRELARRCPGIPADVRRERDLLVAAFVARASGARARALAEGRAPGDFPLSHPRFVANLIDVGVAAVTAPVSDEVRGEAHDEVREDGREAG